MTDDPLLVRRVRALLSDASAAFAGTRQGVALQAAADDLSGPLRVALVGMTNAGKSTLLNAMVGERIAATDAADCTRVPTSYADGIASLAWAYPTGQERQQLPLTRVDGATTIDLTGFRPEELDGISVQTPNPNLRGVTFIDTPGTGSLTPDSSQRTVDLLTTSTPQPSPDAVIYLLRHLHSADVNFLEAFRGRGAPGIRPISSIGVLSRADEIGAGRFDALEIARTIAATYRDDRRLRALLQTVVPVAGLLGETAATLREAEFRQLAGLAAAPMAAVQDAMHSVQGVLDVAPTVGSSTDRTALLGRFGLFGISLSVELIRHEIATSAVELADRLLAISGVPVVRDLLRSRFVHRASVLKAQHALHVLDVALGERVVSAALPIQSRIEEIVASDHEMIEIRLLNDLATADVVVSDAELDRLRRVLGSDGTGTRRRLGMSDTATTEGGGDTRKDPTVKAAARDELYYWQRRLRDPLASPTERRATGVAVRSCERVLATLAKPA